MDNKIWYLCLHFIAVFLLVGCVVIFLSSAQTPRTGGMYYDLVRFGINIFYVWLAAFVYYAFLAVWALFRYKNSGKEK